jgi:hypothetical protein
MLMRGTAQNKPPTFCAWAVGRAPLQCSTATEGHVVFLMMWLLRALPFQIQAAPQTTPWHRLVSSLLTQLSIIDINKMIPTIRVLPPARVLPLAGECMRLHVGSIAMVIYYHVPEVVSALPRTKYVWT